MISSLFFLFCLFFHGNDKSIHIISRDCIFTTLWYGNLCGITCVLYVVYLIATVFSIHGECFIHRVVLIAERLEICFKANVVFIDICRVHLSNVTEMYSLASVKTCVILAGVGITENKAVFVGIIVYLIGEGDKKRAAVKK